MILDSLDTVWRTVVVGGLAYIALVLWLRVSGKRTLSKWNAFDFVVTVALGSTLATIILSKSTTLLQGVVAFGLLVMSQWVITWLAVRSGLVRSWIKARPRLLVYQGEMRTVALRQERVTEGEVRAALRGQGITAVEDVEAVVLETDGSFSIIRQRGSGHSALADVEGLPSGRGDAERSGTPSASRKTI